MRVLIRKRIKKAVKCSEQYELQKKLIGMAKNEPVGFRTFLKRKLCKIYKTDEILSNWNSISKFIINKRLPKPELDELLDQCRLEMMNDTFSNQLNSNVGFTFSEDEENDFINDIEVDEQQEEELEQQQKGRKENESQKENEIHIENE